MARVWNFSAGPSTLPEQVLQTAAAEMMDYQGSGQSVMEMSHRSKTFDKIIKDAEALMRELYQVPDNYKVLFLQGGASAQFSAIPLNFMNGSGKAGKKDKETGELVFGEGRWAADPVEDGEGGDEDDLDL